MHEGGLWDSQKWKIIFDTAAVHPSFFIHIQKLDEKYSVTYSLCNQCPY